jgi:hypothetical protein
MQTLPPELLARVIVLSTEPHAHARLAQLAMVCRGWAGVIFGTPTLWNKPVFHSMVAARTLLARSKEVPLDVKIDLRDGNTDELEAAALAIKELGRVKHLNLTALPSALGPLFAFLPLGRIAHTLETLSLSNHSVYTAYLALAHISAPRLERLTLSDFSVSFTSPLLTSTTHLVELNVSRSFAHTDGRPDMASVLSVLSNSKGLRAVTMRNCLPIPSGEDEFNPQVVLSHLSRLELEDGQALVAALLSCISLPSTTTLRLSALADASDDEDFTLLSAAMASHLASSTGTQPIEHVQAALEGRSIRLRLDAVGGRPPRADISLVWRSPDDTRPARVIACALGALPLDGLVALTVADMVMTSDIWRFILRRTPSVQLVQAESEALAGLFESLIAPAVGPLLAPRLRSLMLARVLFSDAAVLHAFVAFVRHWRAHKADALGATGVVGASEPTWTTAESQTWHRDLASIDLDRCGFVSEDSIAQLKEAGFMLA